MEKNQIKDVPETEYEDQSTDVELDKKTLRSVLLRTIPMQATFNYERMQACGWLYALLPGLKKIHKNKRDLAKSMKMHNEFLNTNMVSSTFMYGVILAMEKGKQPLTTMRSFKVATMGPLAGVGDAVINFSLMPILGAISATLALEGVGFAPILFFTVFCAARFALQIPLFYYGYNLGISALSKIKAQSDMFSRAGTIIGLTVIGALTSAFVHLKTTLTIHMSEKGVVNLQESLLDKIMPNLLPLLMVFLVYRFLLKGASPIKVILSMLIGGVCLHYLHII